MAEDNILNCTYFLDVLSQWCFIADDALLNLRRKHGPALNVSLRFVPIASKEVISVTRAEQERSYERSAMIAGVRTVPWVVEDEDICTWEANATVLAAAHLGLDIDLVRRAIAEAALLRGEPIGREGAAIALVSKQFGVDSERLRRTVNGLGIAAQMQAHENEFSSLKLRVRPTFVISNKIDDHIILGGTYSFDLLDHCVRSLKDDAAGHDCFAKKYPQF